MSTKTTELPSISHARKLLMDFMDSKRPWATCGDVYEAMDQIADYAAFAFRNVHIPTQAEVTELEVSLLRFTGVMETHPENYDGPCNCAECRRNDD